MNELHFSGTSHFTQFRLLYFITIFIYINEIRQQRKMYEKNKENELGNIELTVTDRM